MSELFPEVPEEQQVKGTIRREVFRSPSFTVLRLDTASDGTPRTVVPCP